MCVPPPSLFVTLSCVYTTFLKLTCGFFLHSASHNSDNLEISFLILSVKMVPTPLVSPCPGLSAFSFPFWIIVQPCPMSPLCLEIPGRAHKTQCLPCWGGLRLFLVLKTRSKEFSKIWAPGMANDSFFHFLFNYEQHSPSESLYFTCRQWDRCS